MSPNTQPFHTRKPFAGSSPCAVFQMSTASDAVMGAMRQTRAKRPRSRQRRSSGLMLSVTMEPQKMRTSSAPARAKSSATAGSSPATRAPARLAA